MLNINPKINCTICMIANCSSTIDQSSTGMTIHHNYETGEVKIKL